MRRGIATLFSCGLLAGSLAAPAHAQFTDNFDYANNAALQAAWGAPVVGGATATSFTYTAGAGKLNATGMTDSDVGGFATATFNRATTFAGNFVARMEFDWNQSATLGGMFMEVRSATGVIASGGLGDDTGGPGHAYMQVGGATTYLGANGAYGPGTASFEAVTGAAATSFNNAPIVSAAADVVRNGNSLGNSGAARLDIVRVGNMISARIDNGVNAFVLGPVAGSTDNVASISLVFGGFAYGGPTNVLVGDTGTHIGVDKIVLEPKRNPGDADGVNGITIADYQIIQANSFTKQPIGLNGDVNYDGIVDFKDFQEWKTLFPGGVAAAEAAIAALPEPGSLSLALGGLAFLGLKRRNREA